MAKRPAPAAWAEEQPINMLVVGECGDGKSTLINGLRDHGRSLEALCGRNLEGVTKDVMLYPCKDLNGKPFNLIDTPGVGDAHRSPAGLMALLEEFVKKNTAPGGIRGVIVTTPLTNCRMSLGAQDYEPLLEAIKGLPNVSILYKAPEPKVLASAFAEKLGVTAKAFDAEAFAEQLAGMRDVVAQQSANMQALMQQMYDASLAHREEMRRREEQMDTLRQEVVDQQARMQEDRTRREQEYEQLRRQEREEAVRERQQEQQMWEAAAREQRQRQEQQLERMQREAAEHQKSYMDSLQQMQAQCNAQVTALAQRPVVVEHRGGGGGGCLIL